MLEPLIPKEKHQAVLRLSTSIPRTKPEAILGFLRFFSAPQVETRSLSSSSSSVEQMSCKGVTSAQG